MNIIKDTLALLSLETHGDYARLNLQAVENSGRSGFCGLAGRPT